MEAINIILNEKSIPGPDVLFVEIETDDGYSVDIGKTTPYGNGLTKLRITIEDIDSLSKD